MKKLYCLIFLLVMPSVYGMQKKTKPQKKFNIHNVQSKNGKKNRVVIAKKKQSREEQYQLKRAIAHERENLILASLVLGAPLLLYAAVTFDHHTRGISSSTLFNWCIDKTYSNTPF